MTLILTLGFDPASQEHFDTLRQRHFPPERNLVPAHLTLFHALPESQDVLSTLDSVAAATRPFSLTVSGLRSLGRGVAYTLQAPEIQALHRALSASFTGYLTAQDRQPLRPHVVLQNKTTAEQAKALLALLNAGFATFAVQARGLDLWHYRGGPWEAARRFDFTA